MVATWFKVYQSSASSSIHYPSATCVSNSMAPSPSKTATTMKGKRYKGIPTRHPFKKIRRSVVAFDEGQQSLVTSPIRSTHAGRSPDPISPVIVKKEVLEGFPLYTCHPSASSSVLGHRGSVEKVVLNSYSSDGEDNVLLSTLLHRKAGNSTYPKPTQVPRSPPRVASPLKEVLSQTMDHGTTSIAPDSPKASLPIDAEEASDDTNEDYVPTIEETLLPEETMTSTEDPISSPELLNQLLGIILPPGYSVSYPTPESLA